MLHPDLKAELRRRTALHWQEVEQHYQMWRYLPIEIWADDLPWQLHAQAGLAGAYMESQGVVRADASRCASSWLLRAITGDKTPRGQARWSVDRLRAEQESAGEIPPAEDDARKTAVVLVEILRDVCRSRPEYNCKLGQLHPKALGELLGAFCMRVQAAREVGDSDDGRDGPE